MATLRCQCGTDVQTFAGNMRAVASATSLDLVCPSCNFVAFVFDSMRFEDAGLSIERVREPQGPWRVSCSCGTASTQLSGKVTFSVVSDPMVVEPNNVVPCCGCKEPLIMLPVGTRMSYQRGSLRPELHPCYDFNYLRWKSAGDEDEG